MPGEPSSSSASVPPPPPAVAAPGQTGRLRGGGHQMVRAAPTPPLPRPAGEASAPLASLILLGAAMGGAAAASRAAMPILRQLDRTLRAVEESAVAAEAASRAVEEASKAFQRDSPLALRAVEDASLECADLAEGLAEAASGVGLLGLGRGRVRRERAVPRAQRAALRAGGDQRKTTTTKTTSSAAAAGRNGTGVKAGGDLDKEEVDPPRPASPAASASLDDLVAQAMTPGGVEASVSLVAPERRGGRSSPRLGRGRGWGEGGWGNVQLDEILGGAWRSTSGAAAGGLAAVGRAPVYAADRALDAGQAARRAALWALGAPENEENNASGTAADADDAADGDAVNADVDTDADERVTGPLWSPVPSVPLDLGAVGGATRWGADLATGLTGSLSGTMGAWQAQLRDLSVSVLRAQRSATLVDARLEREVKALRGESGDAPSSSSPSEGVDGSSGGSLLLSDTATAKAKAETKSEAGASASPGPSSTADAASDGGSASDGVSSFDDDDDTEREAAAVRGERELASRRDAEERVMAALGRASVAAQEAMTASAKLEEALASARDVGVDMPEGPRSRSREGQTDPVSVPGRGYRPGGGADALARLVRTARRRASERRADEATGVSPALREEGVGDDSEFSSGESSSFFFDSTTWEDGEAAAGPGGVGWDDQEDRPPTPPPWPSLVVDKAAPKLGARRDLRGLADGGMSAQTVGADGSLARGPPMRESDSGSDGDSEPEPWRGDRGGGQLSLSEVLNEFRSQADRID